MSCNGCGQFPDEELLSQLVQIIQCYNDQGTLNPVQIVHGIQCILFHYELYNPLGLWVPAFRNQYFTYDRQDSPAFLTCAFSNQLLNPVAEAFQVD